MMGSVIKKTMAVFSSGSLSLGMGHIMRTLVIAEKLKNIFSIYYIRENGEEYKTGADELKKRGYKVYTENMDTSADLLLLDSYNVTENTLRRLREKYKKLVYIDDLCKLSFYDCDMVINKNLGAENLIYNTPDNCETLLGPLYALLRDEFQKASSHDVSEDIKNILITMGGTDPKNTSVKVLNIVKNTSFNFNVALSPGFSDKTKYALKKLSKENRNITLFENPKMAELISKCDMAITAGGGTTHEIASLGVPQIMITVAENQFSPLSFGEDNGLYIYGGKENELNTNKFLSLFNSLAKDFDRRKKLSESQKNTINKNGADLVAEKIKKLILL